MNNQGKNQMSSIRGPRGMMKGPVVKPKMRKKHCTESGHIWGNENLRLRLR